MWIAYHIKFDKYSMSLLSLEISKMLTINRIAFWGRLSRIVPEKTCFFFLNHKFCIDFNFGMLKIINRNHYQLHTSSRSWNGVLDLKNGRLFYYLGGKFIFFFNIKWPSFISSKWKVQRWGNYLFSVPNSAKVWAMSFFPEMNN